jgi:hypothetical protein
MEEIHHERPREKAAVDLQNAPKTNILGQIQPEATA